MNVLFIVNLPSPYRVEFFNELSNYVNLTVLYERNAAKSRNTLWKQKSNGKYKEIYLNSKRIGDDNSISFGTIKYLKKRKYDFIIIGQYSTITAMISILVLKIKGIKFILNSDGGFVKKSESWIKKRIKRFFISSASWWLSTGSNTTEYLKYYGAKENKIFMYPFSSFKKRNVDAGRKKRKIKNVLYVGQFIHRKGIDLLLNSIKYLDDKISVTIVGGTLDEMYLSMIPASFANRVKIIDFVTGSDLERLYLNADLFVFPTREDIWGLVVNEALSYGVPVVSSNKCAAALDLIVDGYNGYIVTDNENPEQYATYINTYFNNNYDFTENCISSVADYTIENMAKVTFEVLNKIKESRDEN